MRSTQRVVVVMWWLLSSMVAHAEDKAAAEQLFRIGAAAYKDGNYSAAVNNFDQAYENFKAPEIAFSAAQAHRLQYGIDRDPVHVKRAIELFEAYLAGSPSGSKRQDAKAHLARLREVFAQLEAAGTKVVIVEKTTPSIYVSVAVDNPLITIDGKSVDRYTSIEVAPGEHTIAVSADGYHPVTRKLTVTKGQAMVPIELKPRPAALSIDAQPGARVVIDGRPVVLGDRPIEVAPGQRLITVFARGRQPVSREVELSPGQEMAWHPELHSTTQRKLVKWVAFGAGGLLVAAGVTGAVALAADFSAADLRDSRTPLSADDATHYDELRDRRDTFRTTALLLGGASLLAGGAALWMYYMDNPSSEQLGRAIERPKASGFAPMALGSTGPSLGLGYGGAF